MKISITRQRLFIESVLALFVAKEWEELRAVYKMSTLSAQEVFWSSWKFNPSEGFYLQKMLSWCAI